MIFVPLPRPATADLLAMERDLAQRVAQSAA
jgi:hypothetical protein